MKSNITLSLDIKNIERLKKEKNYSDVVDKQISAYYNVNQCKNLAFLMQNHEKKRLESKKIKKEIKEIAEEIDKIKQKDKEINELLKNKLTKVLKPYQIQLLKKQENINYDEACDFCVKEGLVNKGIGGIKLIKLWEEIKNGNF